MKNKAKGKVQKAKVKAGATADGRHFRFGFSLLPFDFCTLPFALFLPKGSGQGFRTGKGFKT